MVRTLVGILFAVQDGSEEARMNGFSVFGGGFGAGRDGHFRGRWILHWRTRCVLALLVVVATGCFWEERDSAQEDAADFGWSHYLLLAVFGGGGFSTDSGV